MSAIRRRGVHHGYRSDRGDRGRNDPFGQGEGPEALEAPDALEAERCAFGCAGGVKVRFAPVPARLTAAGSACARNTDGVPVRWPSLPSRTTSRPGPVRQACPQARQRRAASTRHTVARMPRNERWCRHDRDDCEHGNHHPCFGEREAARHTRQIRMLLHLHSLTSRECNQFTQAGVRRQSAQRPG